MHIIVNWTKKPNTNLILYIKKEKILNRRVKNIFSTEVQRFVKIKKLKNEKFESKELKLKFLKSNSKY